LSPSERRGDFVWLDAALPIAIAAKLEAKYAPRLVQMRRRRVRNDLDLGLALFS